MPKFFHQVSEALDVKKLQDQLMTHPELWRQNAFRTGYTSSPFAATSDIWLRYRAPEELLEPKNYLEPHVAVNYPAWDVLTEIHPFVIFFQELVGSVALGGILVTKKPPGAVIPSHSDRGSWHAANMDAKIWMTISGPDENCPHIGGGEEITMKPGEGWTFNNLLPHAVENRSDQDQITLIISMRSANGNFLEMKE